jgi:hypothetical protein
MHTPIFLFNNTIINTLIKLWFSKRLNILIHIPYHCTLFEIFFVLIKDYMLLLRYNFCFSNYYSFVFKFWYVNIFKKINQWLIFIECNFKNRRCISSLETPQVVQTNSDIVRFLNNCIIEEEEKRRRVSMLGESTCTYNMNIKYII